MVFETCPDCDTKFFEYDADLKLYVCENGHEFDTPDSFSDDPEDHKNEPEDSKKGENR